MPRAAHLIPSEVRCAFRMTLRQTIHRRRKTLRKIQNHQKTQHRRRIHRKKMIPRIQKTLKILKSRKNLKNQKNSKAPKLFRKQKPVVIVPPCFGPCTQFPPAPTYRQFAEEAASKTGTDAGTRRGTGTG